MLKKHLPLLLVPLITIPLFACGQSEESYSESELLTAEAKMETILDKKNPYYSIDLNYRDSYFLYDARNYSKEIAMLSFGSAISASNYDWISHFYTTIGFDNFHASDNYGKVFDDYGATYFIAHKRINDYDLISLTFIGDGYKNEWVSNFDIGESGHHHGFDHSSDIALNDLKDYISTNYSSSKLKFWLSGYSRGGGIANLSAHKILANNLFDVIEKDVFAYTFEAPAAVDKNELKNYSNIYNLHNAYDIVTYIPPTQYGLYRKGKDIEIYSDKINEYMAELNLPDANVKFIKTEKITNPTEFLNNIIKRLLSISAEGVDISTRKLFCENIEDVAKKLIRIMSLASMDELMDFASHFSDLSTEEILALLNGDNLYNSIIEALDDAGIDYEPTDIQLIVNKMKIMLPSMVQLFFADLLTMKDNYASMIKSHFPECVYALVHHYNS